MNSLQKTTSRTLVPLEKGPVLIDDAYRFIFTFLTVEQLAKLQSVSKIFRDYACEEGKNRPYDKYINKEFSSTFSCVSLEGMDPNTSLMKTYNQLKALRAIPGEYSHQRSIFPQFISGEVGAALYKAGALKFDLAVNAIINFFRVQMTKPYYSLNISVKSSFFDICKDGSAQLCKALIDIGADVNLNIGSNAFPLITAAEYGNLPVAQVLLQNGARVNEIRRHGGMGRTALEAAAQKGHAHVIQLLLENGAQVNLFPQDDEISRSMPMSPTDYAFSFALNNKDIVGSDLSYKILKEHGGKSVFFHPSDSPNAVREYGRQSNHSKKPRLDDKAE